MMRGEILIKANHPAKAKINLSAVNRVIDALSSQFRYSCAMQQLSSDIASRIHVMKLHSGKE